MSAYLETRSCIFYIAKVPAWPQWLHRISHSLQLQSRGGTACQIPIYRMDLAKSCTGVAPALASHDTVFWPCVTQVDFAQANLTVCRLRMKCYGGRTLSQNPGELVKSYSAGCASRCVH
jgi:hypothetical protein